MESFARALTGVAMIYGETLTPARIESYWAALEPYGEDNLIKALKQSVRENKFFPRPAELVAILEGSTQDIEAESFAAWAQIQVAMSNPAAVSDLAASDPRAKAGLDSLGGWYSMRATDEDPRWQRQAFSKAFMGAHHALQRERREQLMAPAEEITPLLKELAENMKMDGEEK